jgi:hypothetical protein
MIVSLYTNLIESLQDFYSIPTTSYPQDVTAFYYYDLNLLDTVLEVSTWFRKPQGSVESLLRSGFYIEPFDLLNHVLRAL